MANWIRQILRSDLGGLEINLYDWWHIGYLVVIFGAIIGASFILKGKTQETKKKTLNILLIITIMLYVLDFFVQPLYRGTMDTDKLPFHICTILCILDGFANFNKKFTWLKTPAVVLSVVAPLMYLTYPGSALGGVSPICYQVEQTFLYHGVLLAYGFLSLTTGEVKLDIKKIWKELLVIIGIAIWAGIGNIIYITPEHHYDWFFITGSTFPFVPTWLMPFAVIASVFGMCLIIYGLYYLILKIINKNKKNENYVELNS